MVINIISEIINRNTDIITVGLGGMAFFLVMYIFWTSSGSRTKYIIGLISMFLFAVGVVSAAFWIFGLQFTSVVSGG